MQFPNRKCQDIKDSDSSESGKPAECGEGQRMDVEDVDDMVDVEDVVVLEDMDNMVDVDDMADVQDMEDVVAVEDMDDVADVQDMEDVVAEPLSATKAPFPLLRVLWSKWIFQYKSTDPPEPACASH
ncbi:hypothetical protein HispidOSU_029425 [Sigmodon hispidus]